MNLPSEANSNFNGPNGQKIFIHRDYSQGTGIRFNNKFPQELDGLVSLSSNIICSFLRYFNSFHLSFFRFRFKTQLMYHLSMN